MSGILEGNLIAVGIATVSITPSQVSAQSTSEQAFTVPNVRVGDAVSVSPPGSMGGTGVAGAWVSAAGQVTVIFDNPTTGALTPPSGSYKFSWARPDSVQTGVDA
jgi:hypothetical protein